MSAMNVGRASAMGLWLFGCRASTETPELPTRPAVTPPSPSVPAPSTGGLGPPAGPSSATAAPPWTTRPGEVPSACGPLVWATSIGGIDDDEGSDVVSLPDGGFAAAGEFSRTVTFGAGQAGETTLTSEAGPQGNTWVAAFDADGTMRWIRAGYSGDVVRPHDLHAGADGSLVVAGLRGSSSPTTFEGVELPLWGLSDGYVVKYSAAGDLVFATSLNGDGSDSPEAVTTSPDGTVYAVGEFQGALHLPDGQTFVNTTALRTDGWVTRYEADGTFAWARHLAGAERQQPTGVAATDAEVAVIGEYDAELVVPDGPTLPGTAIGADQSFLVSYDREGALSWARADGGEHGSESPKELLHHAGEWITGGSSGLGEYGIGEATETVFSGVISLYTASWRASDGGLVAARELVPTASGGVYWFGGALSVTDGRRAIAGAVLGAELGTGQPNETVVLGGKGRDPFLATFEADGRFHCTWRMEGDAVDQVDVASGVAFDGVGGMWVVGTFRDHLVLSPGLPEEVTLTSAGGLDIFLARYLVDAPPTD